MSTIKSLQENLAKDLVELEQTNIDEETLKKIEAVYEDVYNLIIILDKTKD
jgi:hypothetical protein